MKSHTVEQCGWETAPMYHIPSISARSVCGRNSDGLCGLIGVETPSPHTNTFLLRPPAVTIPASLSYTRVPTRSLCLFNPTIMDDGDDNDNDDDDYH